MDFKYLIYYTMLNFSNLSDDFIKTYIKNILTNEGDIKKDDIFDIPLTDLV